MGVNMNDDTALEYADGNEDFARWLREVDEIVQSRLSLSVFDLRDMLFRDAFDSDVDPHEFVATVVAETIVEDFGEDAYNLLVGEGAREA
jgi:hypothetical protein